MNTFNCLDTSKCELHNIAIDITPKNLFNAQQPQPFLLTSHNDSLPK